MKSISVVLNEHSKYTIDLKDEYKLNEFIEFFEAEIRLVKGYRSDSPPAGASEKRTHPQVTSEDLSDLTEAPC